MEDDDAPIMSQYAGASRCF